MIRGSLIASVAGLALGLSLSAPALADGHQSYDWSGSYFGIKGGGAFSDANASTTTISIDETFDGGTIGIMSGYNWQNGHWVFGLDSDSSYSSLDESFSNADIELKYVGTTRARVGYAYDRFLPYVTGGLATGYADVSIPGLGSESEFLYGYAVGAGFDWAIDDTWHLRAEYLFVDYSEESFTFSTGTLDFDVEELHLVRVGLSMDTDWVFDRILGN